MSVINNTYGFIFVHVPRSAGTSVTETLSGLTNYCDLEIGGTHFGEKIQDAYRTRFGLGKHSTAAEIRNVVGSVTWSRYFTFAFVRNPFTRTLSIFNFLRQWESSDSEFNKQIRAFPDFDSYVLSDIWDQSHGPDQIFRPQTFWVSLMETEPQPLTNFVGKLETLQADLAQIGSMLGLPEHLKRLTPILKNESLLPSTLSKNARVIEKIALKYEVDFRAYGYSTDPSLAWPAT